MYRIILIVALTLSTFAGQKAVRYDEATGEVDDDLNFTGTVTFNGQAIGSGSLPITGGTLTGPLDFGGVHAGIRVNHLTTAQRDSLSAATGQIIYNATDSRFEFYENGAWVGLSHNAITSGSNQGAGGVGVFDSVNGSELEFRNVNAASARVTVNHDIANREVDIDVTESALSINNLSGTLSVTNGGTGATSLTGFVIGNGSSPLSARKIELSATTAPSVNDDITSGYDVGSRWLDTTSNKEYVLLDSTAGAAVWTETTSAGGAVDLVFGRSGTVVAQGSDYDAIQVDNTPAGTIAATSVQAAINELDTEKVATTISVNANGALSGGGTLDISRTVTLDINSQVQDESPDAALDYLLTYDASATAHKKVLIADLPTPAAAGIYQDLYFDAKAFTAPGTGGATFGQLESGPQPIVWTYYSFSDISDQQIQLRFNLPATWDEADLKVKLYWIPANSTIAGNVVWGIESGYYGDDDVYNGPLGNEVEIVDSALVQADMHVTDASPAFQVPGSIPDSRVLILSVTRKSSDIDDTYPSNPWLVGLAILYQESGAAPAQW